MSIHLLLAATALGAAQGQSADPLAPLPAKPAAPAPVIVTPAPVTLPVQLPPAPPPAPVIRIPRDWSEVFAAIRGARWAEARAGIAVLPNGLLSPLARAELYTAKGSPVVSLGEIQALLAQAPDLPQAEQLARLAAARGAMVTPTYIVRRP
ncbi:MAG: lytic transglycosylase domain-containing protein, partial [Sphingomonas sp.]|nr:lytic transglycosylase domain-containing protein [Sphingomonas sp.]